MDKAQSIREVTQLILQHAKPKRIWLYGSQASGEFRQGSDIYIAFEDGNRPDMTALKEAIGTLPTLVKIDVHNLSKTDQRFTNRVITTGRVLYYSEDKKLRAEDGLYNFNNALSRFQSMIERCQQIIEDGYGDIFLDLSVKRFEFTFEMSWKALKRYLEYLGMSCKNPRSCFSEAHTQQIISDEAVWLDMIEMRNRLSHIYNESEISGILDKLDDYLHAFLQLKKEILRELGDSNGLISEKKWKSVC